MKNYFKLYGLAGLIRLSFNLFRTKMFYPKARLIRFPFDIRNRHLIDLGIGLTTGIGCRIEVHPIGSNQGDKCLKFGKNVEINDYVHIAASKSVIIGDNVLIAGKAFITDISHGCYSGNQNIQSTPFMIPNKRPLFAKPVIIERNVWIGESVSILPGVRIGEGVIVGANSVVSKSLPAFIIAVGNPAKAIKKFNFETKYWEII